MMDSSEAGDLADESALRVLLDQAILGDAEAAEHLVTLLGTKYYQRVLNRLEALKTEAKKPTLQDIFQDSIIELTQSLKSGGLKDLAEKDRQNVLYYFQNLCRDNLKNLLHRRKSPLLKHHLAELPEGLADPNVKIPGEQRHTEHLELIAGAINRLDPDHALIMKLYKDQVSFEEMGRRLDKNAGTLRNQVVYLKEKLIVDIASRSETANFYLQKRQKESAKRPPTWEELAEAVELLPPKLREAAHFVAVEGRSIGAYSRGLGEGGPSEVEARLFLAYENLSKRFGVEFPDALGLMGPRPRIKGLNRKRILEEIDELPQSIKEAFHFVHVEGHTLGELAKKIGDADGSLAQGRLDRAYVLLNERFNDLFPEAYEQAPE